MVAFSGREGRGRRRGRDRPVERGMARIMDAGEEVEGA